jgi:hypothetical protein
VLGAVPLVLLFEVLTANFPNYFSILLGIVFIMHRLLLPRGVIGLLPSGRVIAAQPRSPPDAHGAGRAARSVGLRKAFGGLVAVDDLSFSVDARRADRPDRPERLGQDHGAQPDLRRAVGGCRRDPLQGARSLRDARRFASRGSACAHLPARARARSMTVIENVMPGLHSARRR